MRDELLNQTLFISLAHVRSALAERYDDYNTLRPHSGLGDLPAANYAGLSSPPMQGAGLGARLGASAPYYGVGMGTIHDIRSGRHGCTLARYSPKPNDDSLSVAELVAQKLKELAALVKWHRAAMRRAKS